MFVQFESYLLLQVIADLKLTHMYGNKMCWQSEF